jgi:hypothetical protein
MNLMEQEFNVANFRQVLGFFEEIMAENIAMESTLRHLTGKASWEPDYQSYLGMSRTAAAAAFAGLFRALDNQSSLGHELEEFAKLYPVKPQSDRQ